MTTINVDRLDLEKSGQRGGKPWHLFNVHGTYADGNPLENVRTFDNLPKGTVDVELQPYTSDDGASWTAKLKGAPVRRAVTRNDRPVQADSSSEFETDVLKRLDRIERLLKLVVTNLPDEEQSEVEA